MNKREFYKELMSEYTFDKEKILANAKKGKMAGRKSLPLYIGMTAAAAAVAVVVTMGGVSIVTNMQGKSGVVLNPTSVSTLGQLTPEERIRKAVEELRQNENSSEMRDVLVTFSAPLAPPQAQGVLASQSNVMVEMLIMEDDTRITTSDAIGAAFNGGTAKIRAAVINCPGYLMTQIDASEFVKLVEVLSKEDLAELATIETVVTPPDNNSNDNTSSSVGNNQGMGGDVPNGPMIDIDDPSPVIPDGDGNKTPEEPDDKPVDKPVTPTNTSLMPEGVVLPSSAAEKPSYITDDIGAEKAYFLTDDIFLVRTKSAIRLYKWNGEAESLVAEQAAEDVKVCWISEKGSRLMVTSTENGVRNKMYIVDASNCTINDMKIDEIVGGGSIYGAAYNESLDILALNVNENGWSDVYVANLAGYQAANVTLVASGLSEGASLLAAYNGAVYFSNTSNSATTVYKYAGGSVTEAAKLEGAYIGVNNSAFTHAIVLNAESPFVFDPATETFIPVQSGKTISFGVSAHSLTCNGGYYTIANGQLLADDSVSVIAKIDFTRSFSTKHVAVVSNGSVRIVPAIYTSRVYGSDVTFAQPEENASAEARAAVNSAIGMINALADESLAQSGIDTAEKLSQTIGVCFTSSAASELKARCGISDNSLEYKSESLTALSVADTVLVMENGENGTLYVKVGAFDGKAAYKPIAVNLLSENGVLKADCVIN